MSADEWVTCPKCKQQKKLRIDGLYDYTVNVDGTITTNIRAKCYECGFEAKS